MNSPFNKPISDFIKDFKLLDGDSVKHFDAKILYLVNLVPHIYECPVAIVTIYAKQLDAVYLLSSQVKEDGLDEMFLIKNEKIRYEKNEYLLIEREGSRIYIFHKSLSNPEKIISKL